jgi:hypothetical protein
MKLTLLSLLVLYGCGWLVHPIDHSTRSSGKLDHTPSVLLRLSVAPQVCATHLDGTTPSTPVMVFINLLNLPPQPIRVVVNEKVTLNFYGTVSTVDLKRAGLGTHRVDVFVDGFRPEPFSISWSVWRCPGFEGDPLRKRDGTLKGYEE